MADPEGDASTLIALEDLCLDLLRQIAQGQLPTLTIDLPLVDPRAAAGEPAEPAAAEAAAEEELEEEEAPEEDAESDPDDALSGDEGGGGDDQQDDSAGTDFGD